MSLAQEANQRGLKDFLTLYNTITEYCFDKCISNFNERSTESPENSCITVCAENYVQFNQRFMFNFVDHQERRKNETEKAASELAAKNAAEAEAQQASAAAVENNSSEQIDTPLVDTSSTTENQSPQETAENNS